MNVVELSNKELYTINYSSNLDPVEKSFSASELVELESIDIFFKTLEEAKGYLCCLFDYVEDIKYGCVLKHSFYNVANDDITSVDDDYVTIEWQIYISDNDLDSKQYS